MRNLALHLAQRGSEAEKAEARALARRYKASPCVCD